MTDDDSVLDTVSVGRILGVSAQTVVRYLNESKPGKRYGNHPFPTPDGRGRGRLFWLPAREADIKAWNAGRAGTGWHFPPCSCASHQSPGALTRT